MKMLLVDPDPQRGPTFAVSLAGAGVEVSVAPSGSFALTMLEWNKHEVIVSRARLGDMDGAELCAILRSDPSTKDVRFVLVAAAGEVTPAQTADAGIDLVLPDALTGPAIVTRVVQLVRMQLEATGAATSVAATPSAGAATTPSRAAAAPASPPPAPPRPAAPVSPVPAITPPALAPVAPAPAVAPAAVTLSPAVTSPPVVARPVAEPIAVPAPATPVAAAATNGAPASIAGLDALGTNGGARTFQGTLGVLEIEELTQAIAVGGKTGRLMLVLAVGGGQIVFEAGRVTHAEFTGQTGESAFGALVVAAHRERGGKFCFIPAHPSELSNQPRTIDRGVDQLLLDVVTAMDEEKRA